MVALVRLVGMLLLVYVKAEHTTFVRNVAVETVGTGFMGKMVSLYQNSTDTVYLKEKKNIVEQTIDSIWFDLKIHDYSGTSKVDCSSTDKS